jgi:hypothetical protein
MKKINLGAIVALLALSLVLGACGRSAAFIMTATQPRGGEVEFDFARPSSERRASSNLSALAATPSLRG